MSSPQKQCLIDELLIDLDKCTKSIKTQNGTISDIIEKSNNVLLQVEAANYQKPNPKTPNAIAYTCNKDIVHALATIVESFQKLVCNENEIRVSKSTESFMITKNKESFARGTDFEKFFLASRQKVECLGGTVRKLLAISDTVAQMKVNLQQKVEASDEVLSE